MLQQSRSASIPVRHRVKVCSLMLSGVTLLVSGTLLSAQTHKDFKYNVSSGATVSLFNNNGNISVHPSSSRTVAVAATLQSDKVEVDSSQTGNRVTVRTHLLQKPTPEEMRVDYDISLPSDASLSIDSENGPIKIDNLQGNIIVESDAGTVDVTGFTNGSLQVETVSGAISLKDIKNSRVSVTSTGGNVILRSVTGPKISVQTTTGAIQYAGDFSGGGVYNFMNHTGDIDVEIPSSASVDLSARSVKGQVIDDFPFQKAVHPGFQLTEGRSFAGTSNSAASMVELRSFSGKIRVKKQ